MKNSRFVSLILAVTFALIPVKALAKTDREENLSNSHVLSADVLAWTSGNIKLQYEHALGSKLSWTLPLWIGFSRAIFNNPGLPNAAGASTFVIAPAFGLKYYITGQAANHGLYAHGNLSLPIWAGGTNTMVSLNYNMAMGYSHTFCGGFWLDGFAGLGGVATPLVGGGTATAPFAPAWNVGMMVGYAW